jgi:MFS family permease
VENDDCSVNRLPSLLPSLSRQAWVQAIGRTLYQAGYGSIQFFIPLIFVKQVGLSATIVGIGIGSGSLAGVVGHFLGGYLADSPSYGRKKTLLFSAILSILAAFILALTQNLPLLFIANLLMGLSAGCYWTAADTIVMDVTDPDKRHQAFAVLVLADSLGAGFGIWAGGSLLSLTNAQTFFFADSFILLIFLLLAQIATRETRQEQPESAKVWQKFVTALNDHSLRLFVLVSVLFTTYVALVNIILPLYLTNIVANSAKQVGLSVGSVANLFTWCYVGIGAVLQLPLVQMLGSLVKVQVLIISMLLWGVGFFLVWATGMVASLQLVCMSAALIVLSIATAIYKPFAPTVIAELAPESLRVVYLSISYQCWSIGYFIGSIFGGWAMDQSRTIAHYFWIVVALSTICGLLILYVLGQRQLLPPPAPVPKDPASVI